MTHNYRDPYDDEAERIHNEVIVVDDDEETLRPDDDAPWHDAEESEEDEERPFVGEDEENGEKSAVSPWTMITTGRILPEGKPEYYKMFIAIAFMCFLSIFLTFMSLNASREYRQKEKYASVLHERSVLKEEERYSLSSKRAVTKRLKEHGIELIDLTKDSRLIEE